MSIQAVAWVLGQKGEDLPGTARLVLISLANHANHESGHCFPSVDLIAREAGCSERSASRYIYALSRNSFIDVRRTPRKDGQFRSNDYWILFDRKPGPWQYFNRDGFGQEIDDDPPDIEPDANLADGENTANGLAQAVDNPEDSPGLADGPSATVGVTHKMLQPSGLQPSPTEQVEGQAAKPPEVPPGYRPEARTEQAERLKAANEARKPKRIPVFEGSDPWNYWLKHGHPPTLFTWFEHDGKRRKGWWFPTLYPPKTTRPPSNDDRMGAPSGRNNSPENQIEDISELANEMGR